VLPRALTAFALAGVIVTSAASSAAQGRARARTLGVAPGIFQPGALNAITDVAGVRVGQVTVTDGDSVHTGVTAILPHPGNSFRERVPAAIYVGNGFGKLLGTTQVLELGELETPILLTCTLCVWKAADAMVEWLLAQPDMGDVRSINPVVAETNDGTLNAIRSRPITARHVRDALALASAGAVEEGSVGAGMGTVAFGWKGGIGTSSRVLPKPLGGWTVGVLAQTNFGGILQVMGAPVGRELDRYSFQTGTRGDRGDGSIMIVIATDAPLSDRNLARLASRAMLGLARTGSFAANGSGDYAIAFSTSPEMRFRFGDTRPTSRRILPTDAVSPLFQAALEATEEAVYNSLFQATTVRSAIGTAEAIPIDRVRDLLKNR
jgi:D-aminopeptidase